MKPRDLLILSGNLSPSDSGSSTIRKLVDKFDQILNPPPSDSGVDYWSIKMTLMSTGAAALRPSIPFQSPTGDRSAMMSGGMPSAHDSFVVLNMFAFSLTFSVMLLKRFPKAAAVFRSCANICMLAAFVILAFAVSSLNVYISN